VSAGTEQKTCTKCGETKALDAFAAEKKGKFGRRASCKACCNAHSAKYYATNRAQCVEARRRWAENNPDRVRDNNRAWRENNAEHLSEYYRAWYAANPDAVQLARARRRARVANAPHEPYSRTDIFAAYGDTCTYCDAPAEHLDHVVPISKGGADAAHNLLPACAPCNLSKSDKSLADWALSWVAKP
jgi:5-methylcytosine-specific restriction endonuclease McrA